MFKVLAISIGVLSCGLFGGTAFFIWWARYLDKDHEDRMKEYMSGEEVNEIYQYLATMYDSRRDD